MTAVEQVFGPHGAERAAVADAQPPDMSPNTYGPAWDAPHATARQILRVMRHRSLSVRKEADMPA